MSKRTKIILSAITGIGIVGGICVNPIAAAIGAILLGGTLIIGLIVYEILNLLD
jgi:hypothetical protein